MWFSNDGVSRDQVLYFTTNRYRFSVQIFREAGLSEENGLNMNIGQYALGLVGTVTSWLLMRRFGRRALFFYGLCMLFCFLMVIGGLGVISQENVGAAWALGSILLIYTYAYNCTVGPIVYCIVSEVPSTRVKIKTVVLARNVYNIVSRFNLSVFLLMMNRAASSTISSSPKCFHLQIGTGPARQVSSLLV